MPRYRSVILGCGGRSAAHVRAYQLVDGAEMVACCDKLGEPRERFMAEFGLRGYADPVEMIEREKPDLIHLVTRPSTRVEQLTMVSDLGVPACITEKPIATEARDWRALCRLAETTRTKIGVGAQFRYHPDLTRCREALKSGDLGPILFMEATAGLNVCDQGVHVLDWAMSLNDDQPVTRVFGAASGAGQLGGTHPAPESTTAVLTFANGVTGVWTLGTEAPPIHAAFETPHSYMRCRVAAYCERGRVLFEEFGKWEIVSAARIQTDYNRTTDDWSAGNDQAQANLTKAMFAWLEDDAKAVGTNFARALQQWNAILGLYASATWRRPVAVPFDPPDDLFDQLTAALQG
jgi:predicted dehydrogenase